jgi:hypothetical protein
MVTVPARGSTSLSVLYELQPDHENDYRGSPGELHWEEPWVYSCPPSRFFPNNKYLPGRKEQAGKRSEIGWLVGNMDK